MVDLRQGKRRSLLIGINYFGTPQELHGCVDDVHRMKGLVESWGFTDCQVLLDEEGHKKPTKANIQVGWDVHHPFRLSASDLLTSFTLVELGWLVRRPLPGWWMELKPVTCSSCTIRGTAAACRARTAAASGTRRCAHWTWMTPACCWTASSLSASVPVGGPLWDLTKASTHGFGTWLGPRILVKPLPKGCRLTCLLDACHSAGALDLPFIFTGTPEWPSTLNPTVGS